MSIYIRIMNSVIRIRFLTVNTIILYMVIRLNNKEIELCDEGEDMPDMSKSASDKHKAGVHFAYPAPPPVQHTQSNDAGHNDEFKSVPLEDLMSKLKNM